MLTGLLSSITGLVMLLSGYGIQVQTETVVEVQGFPKVSLANEIATQYYQRVGKPMVYTMLGENGGYDINKVSPTNDHGLCQLHYTRHKQFINSEEFKSRQAQVDYCIGVRNDAVKKKRLPTTFYAYNHRQLYENRVKFIDKQFIVISGKKFYLN